MNNSEKFQGNETFNSKILGTCHSEISRVLRVFSDEEEEVIKTIKRYLLNPSATFLCTEENSEIIRKFINLVNFGLACIDYKGNIIYSNEFIEYIIGEGKEKIDIEKIQEEYPELQLMKIADNWDLLFLTENHNKQLYNEINILEESFNKENIIYKISCELNKKENIEEILATIMNYLNELIPVDRTCFAQFYRQNGTEYLEAVCSETTSSESFIPAGSNKKISSENRLYKIIKDGEIEIVNDIARQLASQNPQSQFTKRIVDEGMFSSMRIPIKDEEENAVGVLFMNSSEKNIYEKSHLEILEKLRPFITSALTRIQKNQKLAENATYDELTKLNNRKAFEEYFHEITQEFLKNFKEGKEKKAALIFIDIDHFKSFNDAYGHEIGDEVLKKIAETLQNSVRESELVFRRGGEEFAILLENLKLADAEKVVKRIQDNLNQIEIDIGGGEKERMTVSIGVVGFGNGIEEDVYGEKENLGINENSIYSVIEKNKQKITQLADKTMYFSKAQGRNRYTLFEEQLDVLSPQGGYMLLESGKMLSLNDLMENNEEEVTLLDFLKTRENNIREKEVLKETVESINLFEHMREEDLNELIPYFEKKEYKENETVLEEGTYSGYIFILKSGLLEVRKEDMKLGEINNGEVFGENAFFYGIHHMADVNALTDSVVWAFPEETFKKFLEDYPHIETRLWNVLKEREDLNKQIMSD